jgi:hypothetical protein
MPNIKNCKIDEVRLTSLVINHSYSTMPVCEFEPDEIFRSVSLHATFDYFWKGIPMGGTSFEERDLPMTDDFSQIIEAMEQRLMRRLGHEGQAPPTS